MVKYLLGECGSEEKTVVEEWINRTKGNQKEFDRLKTIWRESRIINNHSEVDPEEAWKRFTVLRNDKDRKLPGANVVPLFQRRIFKAIAAAAIVLITFITILFNWERGGEISIPEQVAILHVQSLDSSISDTLPDASIVILNRNSRIEYPEKFADTSREVALTGEAFFEVTKMNGRTFVIHTESADIKVLGTSFNIKASPGKTEVIVESGIVEVSNKSEHVQLTAGKKIVVHKEDTVMNVEIVSGQLHQYYRSKQFVCDNTKLSELAIILSEAYGVNIGFDKPSTGNLRISTVFNQESLEHIITIIEQTMGVRADRQADSVIFYSPK